MWTTIKRILYIALVIWTIIVLFIVYRNIEFPFVFQFVSGYVIALILTALYFIITMFLNIRRLKWSTIRKILPKFIICTFAIWALNVIVIYLIKGELGIMDKFIGSITISFCLTFGEIIFEKKNND